MDLRKAVYLYGTQVFAKYKGQEYQGTLDFIFDTKKQFRLITKDGKVDLPLSSVLKIEQPNNPMVFTGKPIPKKQVMKLEPGTWIRVRFPDCEDSVALVLRKPTYNPGDVDVNVYFPNFITEKYDRVMHDQVVQILKTPEVPKL